MAGKTGIIVLVFLLSAFSLLAQQNTDKVKTAQSLFRMLDTYHYSPPIRNSKLSNDIFENIIKTIDPYGLFLTSDNISSLKVYRDSLCTDNTELISGFITSFTLQYEKQLELADSIADRCFTSSVDLSAIDSLVLETNDVNRPKNNQELEVRWRKWIKQGILKSLIYAENDSTLLVNRTNVQDSLYAKGSLLVTRNLIREKRWLNRLKNYLGGIDKFIMNSYLNSIASCYDPHSNYFSGDDKVKFESSLSKDNYAFGFGLGSNLSGDVIISNITPGSPLWYSKKLEKGDVILKMKIPGQDETDLAFSSVEEIDDIFRTLNGDSVEMTVRKLNGSVLKIELVKGKFDTHENQTVGLMLNGEKPFGYIWFSAFYTDLEGYGNKGCSIDFLKELIKLKETGIEGLILDLRNNPGGSEGEALEIASYFVGNGPYAIRKYKAGGQITLEKTNAINWFDGPLVVLVNGSSASASELLSSILQDYNRAIIIGTNTFGKGSEQLVFPIGQKMRTAYKYTAASPEINDFVKVTSGRIYRITGKSYQKVGVKPDIALPDIWDNYIDRRESTLPFALENDSISSSVLFSPLKAFPLDTLTFLSKNRTAKSEKFRQVSSFNLSMEALMDKKNKVPLNLMQYISDAANRDKLTSEIKNIKSFENNLFKVENTSFKIREMQSDSLSVEINTKFIESTQKDINVGEAFSVLMDLAGLLQKERSK
jgi:carboxyl-terminal processing protease